MHTLRFTIKPRSAFGTPFVGDTLFGQLCWALRYRFGNDWLVERLQDYPNGHPYMVLSDAFPRGFLPLPNVPSRLFRDSAEDRKVLKKKRWLPMEKMDADFQEWQNLALSDREAAAVILREGDVDNAALQIITSHPHNSINRATGTTGEGMFAPYSMPQIWFHPAMRFDLYAVIDERRISADDLAAALADIGQSGYGRDASIGLGKFTLEAEVERDPLPKNSNANAWLTLAPCAPQKLGFDRERSFYRPFTRFGRHGSVMALSANPFKRPVLLAGAGGVFVPASGVVDDSILFIGQGLDGVSNGQPGAVSQGYAPSLAIHMEVTA